MALVHQVTTSRLSNGYWVPMFLMFLGYFYKTKLELKASLLQKVTALLKDDTNGPYIKCFRLRFNFEIKSFLVSSRSLKASIKTPGPIKRRDTLPVWLGPSFEI